MTVLDRDKNALRFLRWFKNDTNEPVLENRMIPHQDVAVLSPLREVYIRRDSSNIWNVN